MTEAGIEATSSMGKSAKPPFRADHVGSLLRPAALLKAREDFAAGRIGESELRAAEDDAIQQVVRKQQEVGLRSATDGEFRRASWHMDFIYQLGGVEKVEENIVITFHNKQGDIQFAPAGLRIAEKVRLEHTIFGEAFRYLQSVVKSATPKLTIPSPSMVHYRGGPAAIDQKIYAGIDDFWADLSSAYAEEVRRLYDLGCRYLQFDDTSLAYLNDPKQRQMIAQRGEDAIHLHGRYIANINSALAGKPDDMAITTHMCRGNFRSSWVAEGSYDFVADALFNELDVDGYFMEWDDERSGGFEPLRLLPKGEKVVVLGLVTTKQGEVESRDELMRRIEEASKYAPIEQLCLSPQCGFSSTVEGNLLSEQQQWDKLRLIVETAEEIWG